MLIARKSPFSGKVTTMEINTTDEQIDRYLKGEGLIQEVFPDLTADEREFIKTGITPEEWNYIFGGYGGTKK